METAKRRGGALSFSSAPSTLFPARSTVASSCVDGCGSCCAWCAFFESEAVLYLVQDNDPSSGFDAFGGGTAWQVQVSLLSVPCPLSAERRTEKARAREATGSPDARASDAAPPPTGIEGGGEERLAGAAAGTAAGDVARPSADAQAGANENATLEGGAAGEGPSDDANPAGQEGAQTPSAVGRDRGRSASEKPAAGRPRSAARRRHSPSVLEHQFVLHVTAGRVDGRLSGAVGPASGPSSPPASPQAAAASADPFAPRVPPCRCNCLLGCCGRGRSRGDPRAARDSADARPGLGASEPRGRGGAEPGDAEGAEGGRKGRRKCRCHERSRASIRRREKPAERGAGDQGGSGGPQAPEDGVGDGGDCSCDEGLRRDSSGADEGDCRGSERDAEALPILSKTRERRCACGGRCASPSTRAARGCACAAGAEGGEPQGEKEAEGEPAERVGATGLGREEETPDPPQSLEGAAPPAGSLGDPGQRKGEARGSAEGREASSSSLSFLFPGVDGRLASPFALPEGDSRLAVAAAFPPAGSSPTAPAVQLPLSSLSSFSSSASSFVCSSSSASSLAAPASSLATSASSPCCCECACGGDASDACSRRRGRSSGALLSRSSAATWKSRADADASVPSALAFPCPELYVHWGVCVERLEEWKTPPAGLVPAGSRVDLGSHAAQTRFQCYSSSCSSGAAAAAEGRCLCPVDARPHGAGTGAREREWAASRGEPRGEERDIEARASDAEAATAGEPAETRGEPRGRASDSGGRCGKRAKARVPLPACPCRCCDTRGARGRGCMSGSRARLGDVETDGASDRGSEASALSDDEAVAAAFSASSARFAFCPICAEGPPSHLAAPALSPHAGGTTYCVQLPLGPTTGPRAALPLGVQFVLFAPPFRWIKPSAYSNFFFNIHQAAARLQLRIAAAFLRRTLLASLASSSAALAPTDATCGQAPQRKQEPREPDFESEPPRSCASATDGKRAKVAGDRSRANGAGAARPEDRGASPSAGARAPRGASTLPAASSPVASSPAASSPAASGSLGVWPLRPTMAVHLPPRSPPRAHASAPLTWAASRGEGAVWSLEQAELRDFAVGMPPEWQLVVTASLTSCRSFAASPPAPAPPPPPLRSPWLPQAARRPPSSPSSPSTTERSDVLAVQAVLCEAGPAPRGAARALWVTGRGAQHARRLPSLKALEAPRSHDGGWRPRPGEAPEGRAAAGDCGRWGEEDLGGDRAGRARAREASAHAAAPNGRCGAGETSGPGGGDRNDGNDREDRSAESEAREEGTPQEEEELAWGPTLRELCSGAAPPRCLFAAASQQARGGEESGDAPAESRSPFDSLFCCRTCWESRRCRCQSLSLDAPLEFLFSSSRFFLRSPHGAAPALPPGRLPPPGAGSVSSRPRGGKESRLACGHDPRAHDTSSSPCTSPPFPLLQFELQRGSRGRPEAGRPSERGGDEDTPTALLLSAFSPPFSADAAEAPGSFALSLEAASAPTAADALRRARQGAHGALLRLQMRRQRESAEPQGGQTPDALRDRVLCASAQAPCDEAEPLPAGTCLGVFFPLPPAQEPPAMHPEDAQRAEEEARGDSRLPLPAAAVPALIDRWRRRSSGASSREASDPGDEAAAARRAEVLAFVCGASSFGEDDDSGVLSPLVSSRAFLRSPRRSPLLSSSSRFASRRRSSHADRDRAGEGGDRPLRSAQMLSAPRLRGEHGAPFAHDLPYEFAESGRRRRCSVFRRRSPERRRAEERRWSDGVRHAGGRHRQLHDELGEGAGATALWARPPHHEARRDRGEGNDERGLSETRRLLALQGKDAMRLGASRRRQIKPTKMSAKYLDRLLSKLLKQPVRNPHHLPLLSYADQRLLAFKRFELKGEGEGENGEVEAALLVDSAPNCGETSCFRLRLSALLWEENNSLLHTASYGSCANHLPSASRAPAPAQASPPSAVETSVPSAPVYDVAPPLASSAASWPSCSSPGSSSVVSSSPGSSPPSSPSSRASTPSAAPCAAPASPCLWVHWGLKLGAPVSASRQARGLVRNATASIAACLLPPSLALGLPPAAASASSFASSASVASASSSASSAVSFRAAAPHGSSGAFGLGFETPEGRGAAPDFRVLVLQQLVAWVERKLGDEETDEKARAAEGAAVGEGQDADAQQPKIDLNSWVQPPERWRPAGSYATDSYSVDSPTVELFVSERRTRRGGGKRREDATTAPTGLKLHAVDLRIPKTLYGYRVLGVYFVFHSDRPPLACRWFHQRYVELPQDLFVSIDRSPAIETQPQKLFSVPALAQQLHGLQQKLVRLLAPSSSLFSPSFRSLKQRNAAVSDDQRRAVHGGEDAESRDVCHPLFTLTAKLLDQPCAPLLFQQQKLIELLVSESAFISPTLDAARRRRAACPKSSRGKRSAAGKAETAEAAEKEDSLGSEAEKDALAAKRLTEDSQTQEGEEDAASSPASFAPFASVQFSPQASAAGLRTPPLSRSASPASAPLCSAFVSAWSSPLSSSRSCAPSALDSAASHARDFPAVSCPLLRCATVLLRALEGVSSSESGKKEETAHWDQHDSTFWSWLYAYASLERLQWTHEATLQQRRRMKEEMNELHHERQRQRPDAGATETAEDAKAADETDETPCCPQAGEPPRSASPPPVFAPSPRGFGSSLASEDAKKLVFLCTPIVSPAAVPVVERLLLLLAECWQKSRKNRPLIRLLIAVFAAPLLAGRALQALLDVLRGCGLTDRQAFFRQWAAHVETAPSPLVDVFASPLASSARVADSLSRHAASPLAASFGSLSPFPSTTPPPSSRLGSLPREPEGSRSARDAEEASPPQRGGVDAAHVAGETGHVRAEQMLRSVRRCFAASDAAVMRAALWYLESGGAGEAFWAGLGVSQAEFTRLLRETEARRRGGDSGEKKRRPRRAPVASSVASQTSSSRSSSPSFTGPLCLSGFSPALPVDSAIRASHFVPSPQPASVVSPASSASSSAASAFCSRSISLSLFERSRWMSCPRRAKLLCEKAARAKPRASEGEAASKDTHAGTGGHSAAHSGAPPVEDRPCGASEAPEDAPRLADGAGEGRMRKDSAANADEAEAAEALQHCLLSLALLARQPRAHLPSSFSNERQGSSETDALRAKDRSAPGGARASSPQAAEDSSCRGEREAPATPESDAEERWEEEEATRCALALSGLAGVPVNVVLTSFRAEVARLSAEFAELLEAICAHPCLERCACRLAAEPAREAAEAPADAQADPESGATAARRRAAEGRGSGEEREGAGEGRQGGEEGQQESVRGQERPEWEQACGSPFLPLEAIERFQEVSCRRTDPWRLRCGYRPVNLLAWCQRASLPPLSAPSPSSAFAAAPSAGGSKASAGDAGEPPCACCPRGVGGRQPGACCCVSLFSLVGNARARSLPLLLRCADNETRFALLVLDLALDELHQTLVSRLFGVYRRELDAAGAGLPLGPSPPTRDGDAGARDAREAAAAPPEEAKAERGASALETGEVRRERQRPRRPRREGEARSKPTCPSGSSLCPVVDRVNRERLRGLREIWPACVCSLVPLLDSLLPGLVILHPWYEEVDALYSDWRFTMKFLQRELSGERLCRQSSSVSAGSSSSWSAFCEGGRASHAASTASLSSVGSSSFALSATSRAPLSPSASSSLLAPPPPSARGGDGSEGSKVAETRASSGERELPPSLHFLVSVTRRLERCVMRLVGLCEEYVDGKFSFFVQARNGPSALSCLLVEQCIQKSVLSAIAVILQHLSLSLSFYYPAVASAVSVLPTGGSAASGVLAFLPSLSSAKFIPPSPSPLLLAASHFDENAVLPPYVRAVLVCPAARPYLERVKGPVLLRQLTRLSELLRWRRAAAGAARRSDMDSEGGAPARLGGPRRAKEAAEDGEGNGPASRPVEAKARGEGESGDGESRDTETRQWGSASVASLPQESSSSSSSSSSSYLPPYAAVFGLPFAAERGARLKDDFVSLHVLGDLSWTLEELQVAAAAALATSESLAAAPQSSFGSFLSADVASVHAPDASPAAAAAAGLPLSPLHFYAPCLTSRLALRARAQNCMLAVSSSPVFFLNLLVELIRQRKSQQRLLRASAAGEKWRRSERKRRLPFSSFSGRTRKNSLLPGPRGVAGFFSRSSPVVGRKGDFSRDDGNAGEARGAAEREREAEAEDATTKKAAHAASADDGRGAWLDLQRREGEEESATAARALNAHLLSERRRSVAEVLQTLEKSKGRLQKVLGGRRSRASHASTSSLASSRGSSRPWGRQGLSGWLSRKARPPGRFLVPSHASLAAEPPRSSLTSLHLRELAASLASSSSSFLASSGAVLIQRDVEIYSHLHGHALRFRTAPPSLPNRTPELLQHLPLLLMLSHPQLAPLLSVFLQQRRSCPSAQSAERLRTDSAQGALELQALTDAAVAAATAGEEPDGLLGEEEEREREDAEEDEEEDEEEGEEDYETDAAYCESRRGSFFLGAAGDAVRRTGRRRGGRTSEEEADVEGAKGEEETADGEKAFDGVLAKDEGARDLEFSVSFEQRELSRDAEKGENRGAEETTRRPWVCDPADGGVERNGPVELPQDEEEGGGGKGRSGDLDQAAEETPVLRPAPISAEGGEVGRRQSRESVASSSSIRCLARRPTRLVRNERNQSLLNVMEALFFPSAPFSQRTLAWPFYGVSPAAGSSSACSPLLRPSSSGHFSSFRSPGPLPSASSRSSVSRFFSSPMPPPQTALSRFASTAPSWPSSSRLVELASWGDPFRLPMRNAPIFPPIFEALSGDGREEEADGGDEEEAFVQASATAAAVAACVALNAPPEATVKAIAEARARSSRRLLRRIRSRQRSASSHGLPLASSRAPGVSAAPAGLADLAGRLPLRFLSPTAEKGSATESGRKGGDDAEAEKREGRGEEAEAPRAQADDESRAHRVSRGSGPATERKDEGTSEGVEAEKTGDGRHGDGSETTSAQATTPLPVAALIKKPFIPALPLSSSRTSAGAAPGSSLPSSSAGAGKLSFLSSLERRGDGPESSRFSAGFFSSRQLSALSSTSTSPPARWLLGVEAFQPHMVGPKGLSIALLQQSPIRPFLSATAAVPFDAFERTLRHPVNRETRKKLQQIISALDISGEMEKLRQTKNAAKAAAAAARAGAAVARAMGQQAPDGAFAACAVVGGETVLLHTVVQLEKLLQKARQLVHALHLPPDAFRDLHLFCCNSPADGRRRPGRGEDEARGRPASAAGSGRRGSGRRGSGRRGSSGGSRDRRGAEDARGPSGGADREAHEGENRKNRAPEGGNADGRDAGAEGLDSSRSGTDEREARGRRELRSPFARRGASRRAESREGDGRGRYDSREERERRSEAFDVYGDHREEERRILRREKQLKAILQQNPEQLWNCVKNVWCTLFSPSVVLAVQRAQLRFSQIRIAVLLQLVEGICEASFLCRTDMGSLCHRAAPPLFAETPSSLHAREGREGGERDAEMAKEEDAREAERAKDDAALTLPLKEKGQGRDDVSASPTSFPPASRWLRLTSPSRRSSPSLSGGVRRLSPPAGASAASYARQLSSASRKGRERREELTPLSSSSSYYAYTAASPPEDARHVKELYGEVVLGMSLAPRELLEGAVISPGDPLLFRARYSSPAQQPASLWGVEEGEEEATDGEREEGRGPEARDELSAFEARRAPEAGNGQEEQSREKRGEEKAEWSEKDGETTGDVEETGPPGGDEREGRLQQEGEGRTRDAEAGAGCEGLIALVGRDGRGPQEPASAPCTRRSTSQPHARGVYFPVLPRPREPARSPSASLPSPSFSQGPQREASPGRHGFVVVPRGSSSSLSRTFAGISQPPLARAASQASVCPLCGERCGSAACRCITTQTGARVSPPRLYGFSSASTLLRCSSACVLVSADLNVEGLEAMMAVDGVIACVQEQTVDHLHQRPSRAPSHSPPPVLTSPGRPLFPDASGPSWPQNRGGGPRRPASHASSVGRVPSPAPVVAGTARGRGDGAPVGLQAQDSRAGVHQIPGGGTGRGKTLGGAAVLGAAAGGGTVPRRVRAEYHREKWVTDKGWREAHLLQAAAVAVEAEKALGFPQIVHGMWVRGDTDDDEARGRAHREPGGARRRARRRKQGEGGGAPPDTLILLSSRSVPAVEREDTTEELRML